MTGVVEMALAGAVGMALTNLVQGMVPSTFNVGGAIGKIGIRLGLSYALGLAAEKFGPTRKYASYLAAGGAIGAAQDAFNLFIGQGGLLFPSAAPQQVVQVSSAPGSAGQAMVPASMTGDDSGGYGPGQGMGEIVYSYPGMGEIVFAPGPQGLYQ